MLSITKPIHEFGKLNTCLSKYGARFEFNNEKQVICSSDVNGDDTFVILEGVISTKRRKCFSRVFSGTFYYGPG